MHTVNIAGVYRRVQLCEHFVNRCVIGSQLLSNRRKHLSGSVHVCLGITVMETSVELRRSSETASRNSLSKEGMLAPSRRQACSIVITRAMVLLRIGLLKGA